MTDTINAWRKRIVWDKDWGGVQVSPWGIRKSDGYECQQILTQRGPSKLERRSEEQREGD